MKYSFYLLLACVTSLTVTAWLSIQYSTATSGSVYDRIMCASLDVFIALSIGIQIAFSICYMYKWCRSEWVAAIVRVLYAANTLSYQGIWITTSSRLSRH